MNPNRLFWMLLLLALPPLTGWAQVQYVTINPKVDETHDPDVRIQRVELTAKYTILYLRFAQKATAMPKLPQPFDQQGITSTSSIQFEPTARLYANRGDVSYKFVRAENIPTNERLEVTPGKRVDFVAYFERLAPGITVFDLFECNDRNNNICFNFYGIHVTNPPKSKSAPTKPTPAKPTPTTPPSPTSVAPAVTTVALQGTVRDAKTRKPIGAELAYQPISGKTLGTPETTRADAQTGDYRAVVKPATVYAVTSSAKGYFTKTDTIATGRVDLMRDLTLTPIETGAKLTLQNIEFDAGQYDLRSQSYPELDRLVKLMQDNPTLKIRLEGHTDVIGDFDANLTLSRNRVNTVKSYLVNKGVAADRIETIGYGASRPLTKKNSAQNRRVELVITQS